MPEIVSASRQAWLTPSKPDGVVSGDILVAHTVAICDVASTVTPPAGWLKVGTTSEFLYYGAYPTYLDVWIKVATSSEPSIYTWTVVGGNALSASVPFIYRISGADSYIFEQYNYIGTEGLITYTFPTVNAPANSLILFVLPHFGATISEGGPHWPEVIPQNTSYILSDTSTNGATAVKRTQASDGPTSTASVKAAHLSDMQPANGWTIAFKPPPAKKYIALKAGTSFTVPTDCKDATIHCFGPGGNSGVAQWNAGAGGGAYARKALTLTPGSTVSYQIGTKGASATWFQSTATVRADYGRNSNGSTRGAGGSVANSVGDLVYAGGQGGARSGTNNGGTGGGGGAAGPDGAGGVGGDGAGGSDGGKAGDANGGKLVGPAGATGGSVAGKPGLTNTLWTIDGESYGPGTGGTGGDGAPGPGGLYGGGSGGGDNDSTAVGGPGLIIIEYTPTEVTQTKKPIRHSYWI